MIPHIEHRGLPKIHGMAFGALALLRTRFELALVGIWFMTIIAIIKREGLFEVSLQMALSAAHLGVFSEQWVLGLGMVESKSGQQFFPSRGGVTFFAALFERASVRIDMAVDASLKLHVPVTCRTTGHIRYMKFQACIDCHIDPHRGSFKQRCEECHTTAGWKKLLPAFGFDHSKTKYPLLGKHAEVGCAECHLKADFKKPLPFDNCNDCHKPDPHKGQFEARPKKGECAECHTVDGWKPSLFGVKEHDTSKYPLKGKHVKVECDKCHLPAGKDTIYKVKFAACL